MARVAFVQNLVYEYLGTMYLSAILKEKGHKVELFIEHGQGNKVLKREVDKFDPDIIGFSCTTGIHQWVLKEAREFKNSYPNKKIILGGPHPTFFPEVINESYVDIVCRGEGEYALLELADRIDRRESYSDILNLWVKVENCIIKNDVRPLISNLDTLFFADRDLYGKYSFLLNKSQKVFITSRGCPYSCTYCFNHALKKIYKDKGTFLRWRSVANVIEEMKEVKEEGNLKTVYIQDDTFGINKGWMKDFLQRYKREIGIPFICLLRADLVDEDTVYSLKDAGCVNVFFGIETGSEQLRNMLLKKNISDEQIYKTAYLLKKYKIRFRTYNMSGLPTECLEDAYKTVAINIKINTDYPWSSLFQPFPGTELGEYVYVHNMLEGEKAHFEPSFFKKSSIKLPDKKEIENLQKLLFYVVKFPFIFPLIRKIVKFKLILFYDLLFLLGYLWSFKKSERISWLETFNIGINNIKSLFYKSF